MGNFYHLGHPRSLSGTYSVYGEARWDAFYAEARWSGGVECSTVICPVNPGHRRAGERTGDLIVILSSPQIGDFLWTSYSECLITDHVAWLLQQAGFTGFELRPATVRKVQRQRKLTKNYCPTLWELIVVGRGGNAHPDSGIQPLESCRGCGLSWYTSFRNGIIVNEENWDGSDFFTVIGYPRFILVTERAKDLIATHQLTNCSLTPSQKLEWGDTYRWEDTVARRLALAAKGSSFLLEELKSGDRGRWIDAAYALAEMRAYEAVEHLLKGFFQQEPAIQDSSWDAISQIAGHIDTPPDTRHKILLRLRSILAQAHDEQTVRQCAANAIRAIEESVDLRQRIRGEA